MHRRASPGPVSLAWFVGLASLVPLAALSLVPLVPLGCSSSSPGGPPTADAGDPACLPGATPAPVTPAIHTARWAFEPWLSKDYSSAEDTRAFVQGSIDRGIPIGAAVLDSPWETNYNTFVPDETPGRYAGFDAMVADLKSKNVRLVVWLTQFENASSFDIETGANTHYDDVNPAHDLAARCGFFVDQGQEYGWYKGQGGAVDFLNPSAVAWWRSLQDPLLARGVAGYKLDFGDSYVTTDPVVTALGPVPHQAYSEAYYRELRAYATSKAGPDFVTMVRGWDESYGFAGRTYARPEDAPVVWDGDNRRDWVGVADAMNTTLMNASLGYVVIGTDLGGYLDRDDKNPLAGVIPFDSLVFQRWTAMSALSPFMQMHSRDDLTPWTVPDRADETVTIYRYWATLHHALAPFFYSLAELAYAKQGAGIIRPIGDAASWAGDFRYMLGDAFLVAPLLDATGVRDVTLPAGAQWVDWWAQDRPAIASTTLAQYDSTDRAKYPLFLREGAIVPMHVDSDVLFPGGAALANAWTILAYPSATASQLLVREDDDTTTAIDAVVSGSAVTVRVARAVKPLFVRIRVEAGASAVSVAGQPATRAADFATLAASTGIAWLPEAATRSVWVAVPAGYAVPEITVVSP